MSLSYSPMTAAILPPPISRTSRLMLPDDANPAGNVHGGTILRLIEQAGYIVATKFLNGPGAAEGGPWHGVIVRLEHMEFWAPMYVGEVSTLEATITFVSKRSIEVVVTVTAENVLTSASRNTNQARIWYVPVSAETSKVAPACPPFHASAEAISAGEHRYQFQKMQRQKERTDEEISESFMCEIPLLAQLLLPSDCYGNGVAQGGTVMKLMDNAAGIVAARHCKSNVVTAAIDVINFRNTLRLGQTLAIFARATFTSGRSLEIEVMVQGEDLAEGSRRVCHTALFTFVSLDENGKVQAIPQLEPQTAAEKERFAAGKVRYEVKKESRRKARAAAP